MGCNISLLAKNIAWCEVGSWKGGWVLVRVQVEDGEEQLCMALNPEDTEARVGALEQSEQRVTGPQGRKHHSSLSPGFMGSKLCLWRGNIKTLVVRLRGEARREVIRSLRVCPWKELAHFFLTPKLPPLTCVLARVSLIRR